MLTFFSLVFIIVLLILYDKYEFKDRRFVACAKQFRGPFSIPLIGNIYIYVFKKPEDILTLTTSYFDRFGDTMRIWIVKKLVILSKDPKYFEVLLSSQRQLTKNSLYELLYDWLGTGLLLSTGEKWYKRRKIITPAFHFQILQQFVDIFNYQNKILIDKLKRMNCEKPFDIYNTITSMSLDIISQTSMGVELHAQSIESEYVKAVKDMTYILSDRMMRFWKRSDLIFTLTGDKKRYDKCLQILHKFTRDIVEERRAAIANDNHNGMLTEDESIGIKKKMALLDVLLKSTINGQPLSNVDIAEEVDTFMFEGHDTVTAATCFSLYLLSQHEEVQQKVYEEIVRVVGDNAMPTYNQLIELKYLECCIKESLRLYPPVPIYGRKLDEDMIVDDKLIPADCNFNVMVYHINRDPKYFKNPEEFLPERFLNEANENPFLFVPFSAGPRNCIGQKFAMFELKSTLCNVIRNFELMKGDVPIQLIAQLTLKSLTGVYVGFKIRKNPAKVIIE